MRYFLVLLLVCATAAEAQVDTAQVPVWIDMMRDPNVNVKQASRAFNLYWENRTIEPGSGYKPFKRWEYHKTRLMDDQGFLPAPGHVFHTMQNYTASRSASGNWRPLGPNFNQATDQGDIPGVGRINTVAFHPSDPNTIYVGAPQGGLWRSTDNGLSWNPLTDDLPSLGVSAILIDPNDPSIIYIGTGDRDASDAVGLGVFKSTDNGLSWTQMTSGMGDVTVGEMRFHPDSANIIIAAAMGGVYRTSDSANTWTKTTIINHFYEDLEICPNDPNIVMAVGASRLYRSEDNGLSWTLITGIPQANRMMITVTPDDPNRVYALVTNQRSFHSFYRSDDKGLSFNMMSDSPNIMGRNLLGNDTDGQSWYDATVQADPNNADVIYVGGIHIFKSYDGGVTWIHNSPNMHVDQHYLAFSPHTSEIYMGNDGGLYRSDVENNMWEDISRNMTIGQIYKIGQSASNVNKVLNGFQDNGTARFDGVSWIREMGADGMECQVDPVDETHMYGSIYYGVIQRSSNDGASFHRIAGVGINGINEEGAWVTPFTLAEHDNNVMYGGYENAWRTNNVRATNHDDVVWEKISNGLGPNTTCSVIEHSPADPNILYMAKGTNRVFRSDNCNDAAASVSWITYTSGMLYSGNINDLEAHPSDPNVVYMVKGEGVLKSTDKGQSWTDISLNLPAVTKTCLVYDITSNEGLYVGTMAGVFYKDATMSAWEFFGNGMPYASEITEIEIYYGADSTTKRLRAATYGRGLWESDGYGITTHNFPSTPVFTFVEDNPKRLVHGSFEMNVGFYKNLDNADVNTFLMSEILAFNGTITNFSGGPSEYSFTVEPNNPGIVQLYIPAAVVSDADGVDNLESTIFEVYYDTEIPRLGYEGPGGVGNLSQLSIWLDPAKGLEAIGGGQPVASGDELEIWNDQSDHDILVNQVQNTNRPFYLKGDDGIAGLDAVGVTIDTNDIGDFFPGTRCQAWAEFCRIQCV